jgi:cystathionine beta-lyase
MNINEVIERRGTNSVKWDLEISDGVLPMWVADMDFPVAPQIIDAIRKRLEHPLFGYPLFPDSYHQSIIRWQKNQLGFTVSQDELVYSPSVMAAIRLVVNQYTQEGEAVVIQPPVYYPFFHAVEDQKRKLIKNPLINNGVDHGYGMDLEELERIFQKENPKLLLLCSPHNPVSKIWSTETLMSVIELCVHYQVLCVSDEIHIDLPLQGHQPESMMKVIQDNYDTEKQKDIYSQFIVIQSPSKTFNLPGLSSSQLVIPHQELRSRVKKALSISGIDLPNVLSLVAAEAGYTNALPWLNSVLKQISENRNLLKSIIEEQDLGLRLSYGDATYLAWIDARSLLNRINKPEDDTWLSRSLKKEAKLWLSSGSQFGIEGRGFLRMNLACPKELMEEGLNRLRTWIMNLKK